MVLKSKSVLSGCSTQLVRSRSSDNLPSSQSQVNIQMMSHTLTIREVSQIEAMFSSQVFVTGIFRKNKQLYRNQFLQMENSSCK